MLHPRFGVVTEKPDGSIKVRAVDHMSWSAFGQKKKDSVNGHAFPREKLHHDKLDQLAEVGWLVKAWVGEFVFLQVLELFKKLNKECPSLFTADVDWAFRRIPGKPEDR